MIYYTMLLINSIHPWRIETTIYSETVSFELFFTFVNETQISLVYKATSLSNLLERIDSVQRIYFDSSEVSDFVNNFFLVLFHCLLLENASVLSEFFFFFSSLGDYDKF